MIFNIQRYSTHDGEGIRTMIFFKGCPLRCEWCSNPESQVYSKQIFFDPNICIGCGSCVKLSNNGEFTQDENGVHYHVEQCTDPSIFEDICPTKAIDVVGDEVGIDELIEAIEKDHLFYDKSGGGITFSGGEPLTHSHVIRKVLVRLKALGVRSAIETCLDVPWSRIEEVIPNMDTFLVDLKHIDKDKLYKFTKGNSDNIHRNLVQLVASHANVIIRIPVIPSFNDSEKEIKAMLDYVKELGGIKEVHFLPYHNYGIKKYELLGIDYTLEIQPIEEERLFKYVDYANQRGFRAKIGG